MEALGLPPERLLDVHGARGSLLPLQTQYLVVAQLCMGRISSSSSRRDGERERESGGLTVSFAANCVSFFHIPRKLPVSLYILPILRAPKRFSKSRCCLSNSSLAPGKPNLTAARSSLPTGGKSFDPLVDATSFSDGTTSLSALALPAPPCSRRSAPFRRPIRRALNILVIWIVQHSSRLARQSTETKISRHFAPSALGEEGVMVQTQEKRGNGEAVLVDQPPQKKQAVEEPSAAPPSGIERGTAHPSKEEESKNASTPISNGKPVVEEEEEEEEIEVTNEVDFAMTALLEGHKRGVAYVAFSPDGNQLASCSADSGVKVWDPHKGQLVTDLNTKETAGDLGCHEAGISCIAWSPDSKLICTAADGESDPSKTLPSDPAIPADICILWFELALTTTFSRSILSRR